MGIVVVSSDGHRIVVPVADNESDPKNILGMLPPWMKAPSDFVRPENPATGEEGVAWFGAPGPQAASEEIAQFEIIPHVEGEAPHPHPHPHMRPGCTKNKNRIQMKTAAWQKGRTMRMRLACKMRRLMNSFRAAFGMPAISNDHRYHIHPYPDEPELRFESVESHIIGPNGETIVIPPQPIQRHRHMNSDSEDALERFRFMEDRPHPHRPFHHRRPSDSESDESFLVRFGQAFDTLRSAPPLSLHAH